MPITLNVTSAQTKDNAYQPLTLNVNTNVTATSVTISGTGGVLFNPVEGHALTAPDGAWVLDETKSATITVPGSEAETIPVTPVLTTIANDDDVSVVPFVVEDGKSVVGVKTIPGLTYELVRFTDLKLRANSSTVVTRGTANGARMKLVDDKSDRPSDKAFYIIRVSR